MKGQLFSPSHISPSSVGGTQVGASHMVGLNGTPRSTSQWKCSTLPAQYSSILAGSAPAPRAAVRKAAISSGESSYPQAT